MQPDHHPADPAQSAGPRYLEDTRHGRIDSCSMAASWKSTQKPKQAACPTAAARRLTAPRRRCVEAEAPRKEEAAFRDGNHFRHQEIERQIRRGGVNKCRNDKHSRGPDSGFCIGGLRRPRFAPTHRASARNSRAAEASRQKPDRGTAATRFRVAGKLIVTVGMSITIDSPLTSSAFISPTATCGGGGDHAKEVLITGKARAYHLDRMAVEWRAPGLRLTVRVSPMRLEAVRQQVARDFPMPISI